MTARRLLPILLLLSALAGAEPLLETWPRPEGIPGNATFSLRARVPGGEWKSVDTYAVEVDMHHPRTAAMAAFDFSSAVEVAVTWNGSGGLRSAVVRPLSFGIEPGISAKTVTFTLTRPSNLSLEFNGDIFNNLHLFAGPIQTERPDGKDPHVIRYGPGVHEPGPAVVIPSGTTVYLEGGAVLKSKLVCNRVENVRILGRGLLYQGQRGVEITHSKNIQIEGVTVVNPVHYTVYGGQSQGIAIHNLKAFSSRGWSDGLDFMSCSDIDVAGVFLRNSDDCIAIYGHRWDFSGDSRNVTVRDSTLWADVAHPVMIGTHGNPAQPEVIENLTFANLDILNHDEPQISYQGCFAINASDANLVKNVLIRDVRIEDFEQGQLFNFRVAFNRKFATAPGRGIEGVRVKNVTYQGSNAGISIISGYDDARQVRDVVFEGLRVNGRQVLSADAGRFFIGEHVGNVSFIPSPP